MRGPASVARQARSRREPCACRGSPREPPRSRRAAGPRSRTRRTASRSLPPGRSVNQPRSGADEQELDENPFELERPPVGSSFPDPLLDRRRPCDERVDTLEVAARIEQVDVRVLLRPAEAAARPTLRRATSGAVHPRADRRRGGRTRDRGDGRWAFTRTPPSRPPEGRRRDTICETPSRAHRDAVEHVRGLHRPLLVRDHDELGAIRVRPEQAVKRPMFVSSSAASTSSRR